MSDFFVSYAREDAAFASALVRELERNRWDAWIDESDIPPSVPWMKEIQRALDEAMLVVVVESEAWLDSEPCRIEWELAEAGRVPIIRVNPDLTRLDEIVRYVVDARRALPVTRAVALEAASAAAIWTSRNRARALLVRGQPLAIMRRALRASPDEFSESATAFVRASRRASIRRWTVGLTLGLVAPVLALTVTVSVRVVEEVNERVAQAIADSTSAAERATYAQWNIYSALERMPSDVSDSFSHYYQLFGFLSERTPQEWDPTPVETAGPSVAASPDGTMSAAVEGSQVWITDASGGVTRLQASGRVSALAWSPSGQWIAAATPTGAEVIAVGNGQTIPLLGGSGTPVTVGWPDAASVSVGSSAGTGTWRVFDGSPLAELSEVRFGATVGATLYTVDADGILTATDTTTAVSQTVGEAVPEEVRPSAMDSAGDVVAITYLGDTAFLRVVDTATRGSTDIALPECSPVALSLARDGSAAYLACLEAASNQTRVDLSTGAITSQAAPAQMVYGVRALDDRVVWGGSFGGVFETATDLIPRGLLTPSAGCGAPIRKFPGTVESLLLFPIGDGTGSASCATTMELTGSGAEVHRFIFDASDGHAVPDAAVSADGLLVAYGLSDGRVRVFNTEDYAPVYFAQVMPDQVRDVSFAPDGRTLLVAGAGGAVVSIPLPFESMATGAESLVDDAVSRLQNALDWGIYTSTVGDE